MSSNGSRCVTKAAWALPTEITFIIIALSLGDYLYDVLDALWDVPEWDAMMTLLHTSTVFRRCAINVMYHLWGEMFMDERTGYVAGLFHLDF